MVGSSDLTLHVTERRLGLSIPKERLTQNVRGIAELS